LECGGKRSATPLWIEQPEQPVSRQDAKTQRGRRNYESREKREKIERGRLFAVEGAEGDRFGVRREAQRHAALDRESTANYELSE